MVAIIVNSNEQDVIDICFFFIFMQLQDKIVRHNLLGNLKTVYKKYFVVPPKCL